VSADSNDIASAPGSRSDKAFLGHPVGLGWLAGSEFWERFSYYGMQTLLVLYMIGSLLKPGHIEHVFGFVPFRHAIESVTGPLDQQALASAIFGLYSAFVYLTPLAGGFLADRFLGRTSTVTIGASLMALGHFLMAFDVSFLVALLCLLLGSGCFKGNIASQVGDLYAEDDPRRADAFQIYLLGIQLAVILSPLICGTLGETIAWHWGFGAAGVGMLIGLAIYLIGRPHFPRERARNRQGAAIERTPITAQGWRNILILIALLPVLALSLVGNQEIFNAYMVWAKDVLQLKIFGFNAPVAWIISLDSIVSAATLGLSVLFWRWWGKRWREPEEITKIAIGVTIAAAAPLMLALASTSFAASGHRVSLGWAIAFHLLNDIGFANVLPVGLALYSRASPKGTSGTMIGIYYLHLFAGNLFVGWLGGLLNKMPATTFWLIHVAIMAVAAAVLILVRVTAGRALAPAYEAPHHEAKAA
jgi:proton-dependent oligopeptide transporter, POT family